MVKTNSKSMSHNVNFIHWTEKLLCNAQEQKGVIHFLGDGTSSGFWDHLLETTNTAKGFWTKPTDSCIALEKSKDNGQLKWMR